MVDHGLLAEILILIAIAAAGVAIFESLRLPAIAGFLVMGALVGPGGLGIVSDPERVQSLAELGVVFLLFEIGLELPLDRLQRTWRRALAAGGLQVGVTLAAASTASALWGLPLPTAIVIGALVSMSSTALVMRLLSERGEVDAPHGQLAIGILLFQDLCIVPFLLAVPLLAAETAPSLIPIVLAVLQAVAALAIFYAVSRFLLPPLLDRVARLRSRDLFSLMAVLVVVGSAVAAEEIGLTLAAGAFLGGLVLSASPYAHQLFAEVLPLRGVLLGVFFTAVGMLFEPLAALREWPAVLTWVAGVVVLKTAVVVAALALVLRQGLRTALLSGLALAQTGEFSFVLAAAAATAGLIDSELHRVFVAGSVLTLLATPALMGLGPRLARTLAGHDPVDALQAGGDEAKLSQHVVLIGFGLAGRTLARVLRGRDVPYIALDANAHTVRELRGREPVVYGDATRLPLLDKVGVARARLVAVAINDPIAAYQVVREVRRLAPDAQVVVRARYVAQIDALYEAGASRVVVEEIESAIEMTAAGLQVLGLPQAAIERFASELREEGYEVLRAPPALALDPWLAELLEEGVSEWIDVLDSFGAPQTLVELAVRARTGANVLAIERAGVPRTNPPPDATIEPHDRVLGFGPPPALAALRALLEGRSPDS